MIEQFETIEDTRSTKKGASDASRYYKEQGYTTAIKKQKNNFRIRGIRKVKKKRFGRY